MNPVAIYHCPLPSKFGVPRQAGVAPALEGTIELLPPYCDDDAVRGLDGFEFLWLLWTFSANRHTAQGVTVRPPRLGGNTRLGVFATRSPYRPNPIGLSAVKLTAITPGPVLHVAGADLMDGTPVLDIKPYVPYADAHPNARAGFIDNTTWHTLHVNIPAALRAHYPTLPYDALADVLAQDPRPQYHNDPDRIYGMPFAGHDIKFRTDGNTLTVVDITTS